MGDHGAKGQVTMSGGTGGHKAGESTHCQGSASIDPAKSIEVPRYRPLFGHDEGD